MSDAYNDAPGVRWSHLKHMADSPRHYRYAVDHDDYSPSTAMRIGTAAHLAILEPDRFEVAAPVYDGTRRGKAWDAFQAEHEAADVIVNPREHALAVAMRDAVMSHPAAAALLSEGRPEVPMYWDEQVGVDVVPCKGKLDWLRPGALVDLKTTNDITRPGKLIGGRRYHGQLAHYVAGARANGHRIHMVFVIAVESSPPHDVGVWRLSSTALEAGEALRRDCLRHLVSCQRADDWPGRYPDIVEVDLPAWADGMPDPDDILL